MLSCRKEEWEPSGSLTSERVTMTYMKGGFDKNPENLKKAQKARIKSLGRKPRTAKEHEKWRQKQREKFKLW